MGPSNLALVELYRADQSLREAVGHLESVTREVRQQETRNAQTSARLTSAQTRLRELQSKSANLELDLKMREEHIEKLRNRQSMAANNKEYQALLVEINTAKVDRAKVEEATIKMMEQVETVSTEVKNVGAILAADDAKLAELRQKVGDKAAAAQAEVDRLRPARDAAAAGIRRETLELFDKLADRYDGEAVAAIDRPNPREEEYLCLGCNMGLVADVFNKLKTRDDVVQCPSCKRILYIPDHLTLETTTTKKSRGKSERKVTRVVKPAAEMAQPPGKWDKIVTAAQGESVEGARDADHKPVECKVEINGEAVGTFRGKSADHLERVIRVRLEEQGIAGAEVKVTPSEVPQEASAQA
jgi:predicted  nucleic acid-binding Zn-ribbon protein